MGKVRLGPVALTLIIVVLPFAGMWPDRCDAAGAKVLASASNAPQIVGASAKASGLIAVKQRSNRLNSKQALPAQTNTDTSSSLGESSQGTSQSLTIEKKSVASIPSDSGPKSYPTYKKNSPDITLSLPQAIQIALTRNLTMADSRLAVQEKEYQRREAYSDFFPSITLQYSGTVDRYSNPLFTLGLDGVGNSRYAGSQQAYRWEVAANPPLAPPNAALYPYRIDPYRQFSGALTITQPIFSG
ncbi:MAG: TolC family protein, partial [Desulfomonilaceae bacterium]